MHILFITDNFPPEVNAPATRTFEHCQEWIKQDVKVTVITCVPNFPHGKVYKGYKNKLYQRELTNGIEIIRVGSYITKNEGFLKRILDYFSFSLMAFSVGLFQKFDIVIGTSPQFFTTWTAYGLSLFRGKPWIFELRDLWPESIKSVGALKHKKALSILEKIELFLYRDADAIIPVTNSFKKNLISRNISSNKIHVITNGSNTNLFKKQNKDITLLQKLQLEKKFIVGYIGTHGLAHNLDFIIKSLPKVKNKNIHFLFIGNGATKKSIIELAQHLKLNNVTFLDSIPKEHVPQYLSIIDVSLAPLKKSDTFKSVIPSKIFESASMNKPILLGVQGEAQRIIETYNAGLCFEPENEKDFLNKLLQLHQKECYISCQQGCQKLAQAYDRKTLAQNMLKIIFKTAQKEPSTRVAMEFNTSLPSLNNMKENK